MKKLKLWLDFHKQAFISSFCYLKKEPFVSGMTIFIIAIILILSSLFWVLSDAMKSINSHWQNNKQISLYLDVPSSGAMEEELMVKVLATDGVAKAKLKTSTDGLLLLQAEAGMQDILSYLPENPLPSVIEVTPNSEINSKESLNSLYQKLKAYPSVADARLDLEWINRIFLFFSFMSNILNILIILLSIALILIITNTLRLIINDRREEIMVLKFVGADSPFIMRPFLYSGVWYGLFAAIIAIIFVNLLFLSLQTGVNNLLGAYKINYIVSSLSIDKTLIIVLSAMLFGWIGARISVRNHLNAV